MLFLSQTHLCFLIVNMYCLFATHLATARASDSGLMLNTALHNSAHYRPTVLQKSIPRNFNDTFNSSCLILVIFGSYY